LQHTVQGRADVRLDRLRLCPLVQRHV